MRPVVAFVTDFGLDDTYVGAMKGAALAVCPDATLVDVTHAIAAHDVAAGAFALEAAFRFFPAGTVFVVVVDPGVGSVRRGIAVAAGGFAFVGPDNGVLTPALDLPQARVVELREARYARAEISRTFEGRDRFAPAGAWLARGIALEALGPAVVDPIRLSARAPRVAPGLIEADVIHVDRFGNLVTNLPAATLAAFSTGGRVRVEVGDALLDGIVATYSDVPAGEPCALVGSGGFLEVACNGRSAAARLTLGRGAVVRVRRES